MDSHCIKRNLDRKTINGLCVIVPTYEEAENLPSLVERIEKIKLENEFDLELLLMDDDSQDGTQEVIQQLGKPWVRLVVRTENRGLSPAVIDGLKLARGDVLVVMDADLSHPPEKIPEMLAALEEGADFVIGSRYVKGGSTEEGWGLFRWLNSKIATLLALPFSSAKDPMSGFFALHRSTYLRANYLNPIGYKIGLELTVKCGCKKIREVPIFFSDRKRGKSKLSFAEQLRYIQHLRRLFIYKYGNWSHLAQFAAVGVSGTLINLLILTALLKLNVMPKIAIGIAIAVSMVTNFILNRRFTFSYARRGSVIKQFLGFIGACSLGAAINYATAIGILSAWPGIPFTQIAALAGIGAGMVVNFLANRFLIFRQKETQPAEG